jgi:hypothetical protein
MALFSYVVLTRAKPGREAEFDTWYDERHLEDVARIPGVVAAKRFHIVEQKNSELDVPEWRSLAIYEIDADDPQVVLRAISAASDTEIMPLSDALERRGILQVVGESISTRSTSDE